MQDIIPPRSFQRGQLRSVVRPISQRPVRELYARRRTQVVTDVFVGDQIVETVTTKIETLYKSEPAPMTRGIEHLSPAAKALTLERALNEAQKALKSERRKQRYVKRFGFFSTH